MKIKDIGLFLWIGVVLSAIGIGCCTAVLVMYHVPPSLKGMYIAQEVLFGLNMCMTIIVFFSKVYEIMSKLACLMILSILTFAIGTTVVGISLGKANHWAKDFFGTDGASFPVLFLGVAVLMHVIYIFIIIRSREVIKRMITDGVLTEDNEKTINDYMCGSFYGDDGRGSYVKDDQFDRRKKPSFQNKKRPGPGVRPRNTTADSDDSFDGLGDVEKARRPLINSSPVSSPTHPQQSTASPPPGARRLAVSPTGREQISSPISPPSRPVGGIRAPISPSQAMAGRTISPQLGNIRAAPPRQYVQTPSDLGDDYDSSPRSSSGPIRGRVIYH